MKGAHFTIDGFFVFIAPAAHAAGESAVQVDATLVSVDNFLRDVRP